MTEAVHDAGASRRRFWIQFSATAVGFLVSTWFVSTIVFDMGGPAQTIDPAYRWAVGGVALLYDIAVIVFLIFGSERGFEAWRIEGEHLLLFRRAGDSQPRKVPLAAISSVKAQLDDWDVIARAEDDELGELAVQDTGGNRPGERRVHGGELEVFARGKLWRVFTAGGDEARQAEAEILAAVKTRNAAPGGPKS